MGMVRWRSLWQRMTLDSRSAYNTKLHKNLKTHNVIIWRAYQSWRCETAPRGSTINCKSSHSAEAKFRLHAVIRGLASLPFYPLAGMSLKSTVTSFVFRISNAALKFDWAWWNSFNKDLGRRWFSVTFKRNDFPLLQFADHIAEASRAWGGGVCTCGSSCRGWSEAQRMAFKSHSR